MSAITFTREGRRFMIAVVLIGFAAFSTGNNLIYLLFSLMLSISFITLAVSFMNLRSISCSIDLREPLYAQTPFHLDVTYSNRKRIPSFSVSLLFPAGIADHLYTPEIKKGLDKKSFNGVVIRKRGRYHLGDFRLSTGFPFIFMYISRTVPLAKDILVYPELIDVSTHLDEIRSQPSQREAGRIGQDGDFIFSREYVFGEESRRIDWKATAKTQKTMVREYASNDERLATVILDNASGSSNDVFEKAVSVSASFCKELIQRGYYVRLITCGKIIPFGNSREHLFKMLDILATIRKADEKEYYEGELPEGLSLLVRSADTTCFPGIEGACSGVIDARDV
jgi:uncharacterized protein (DUF58 family)